MHDFTVPRFERSAQVFEHANTNHITLGDLDGDGDPDAVFSRMRAHSTVLFNDGEGRFIDSGQKLLENGHGADIEDLDGDGDLDLFITCAAYRERGETYQGISHIYLNDGRGQFQDSGQDLGDSELSGNAVSLIDIDGDDDFDAHVIFYEAPDGIFVNDGRGIFHRSPLDIPETVSWGDLDGNGSPDIFVRTPGEGFSTMLNDGNGIFTEKWRVSDPTPLRCLATMGDIDGDGDLDAVVTNGVRDAGMPTRIFRNDGTGGMEETAQRLTPVMSGRVGLGDVNADDILRDPAGFWESDVAYRSIKAFRERMNRPVTDPEWVTQIARTAELSLDEREKDPHLRAALFVEEEIEILNAIAIPFATSFLPNPEELDFTVTVILTAYTGSYRFMMNDTLYVDVAHPRWNGDGRRILNNLVSVIFDTGYHRSVEKRTEELGSGDARREPARSGKPDRNQRQGLLCRRRPHGESDR